MSTYIDGLYQQSIGIGLIILVANTCILMIYLLINMANIIELLINRDKNQIAKILVEDKEIHINVGKNTIEFNFWKITKLFWWAIGIAYIIGFAFCYAILIVLPLVLILIVSAKKLLINSVKKGAKGVLRLPLR